MSLILLGILNSQAAGGGPPAYELLQTTVLTTTPTSLTLSGINTYTDYKHLQLRVTIAENFASSGYTDMIMRINADAGANYAYHRLRGRENGAVSSESTVTQSSIRIRCSSVESNIFGSAVIDFLDFSNTAKNTTVRALSTVLTDSESEVTLTSGLWRNTAVISSLTFLNVYGSGLQAGSRFSLYGLKG